MRTLIFELDHSGHRLQYVRVLIDALAPLNEEVLFFTSDRVIESDEYKTHLREVESSFRVITCPYKSHTGPLRRALAKVNAFRAALKHHHPDHVFVPYADGLAQLLGIARMVGALDIPAGVEIEGIMMRGGFAYPTDKWADRLRAWISLAATKMLPFEVLHQLDPIPFSALKKMRGKFHAHCRIIPEPVEAIERIDRAEARRKIGIPVHGRFVVNLGSGDTRKGTDLLLRAFARAKLKSDDRLLLVGKLSSEIRRLIEDEMKAAVQDGRLIVIDQYVSHEQFCLGLNAADVICTPYPRHIGSSGIVVRAAAIGKPILASNYGWVGAVVSTFGLGSTCEVAKIEEFSHQIEASLKGSASYMPPEQARRFVRFHTLANFSAHITARIRARRGEASLRGDFSWEEVMTGMTSISPLLA